MHLVTVRSGSAYPRGWSRSKDDATGFGDGGTGVRLVRIGDELHEHLAAQRGVRIDVQMIDTKSGWKVNRVDILQSPGTSPFATP
jgi:hypothetical protein